MNILFDAWATTMWRACWQGGLVLLVVWAICRLIPSMPACFQCWLWRLAILKFMVVLVVPSLLNVPLLPAHRAPEDSAVVPVVSSIPTRQAHTAQTSATPLPTPVPTPLPVSMPTSTPLSVLPLLLFLLWIIGVGWSLLRLLTAWRDARRLLREGCAIEDTSLAEQLASQSQAFRIRRLPELRCVPGLGSPMLVGIVRPVILMPTDTLGRLSASETTMVLGHELAHIKRGDLLWGFVAALVRAVLFFHPLVWLAQRRLARLQETAADELAIAQQRHDPANYGELLVSVVGKFGPARLLPRISVETVGSLETLKTRLVAMKFIGQASGRIVVTSGILLTAMLFVGLVPWRLVAAEPQQDKGAVAATPAQQQDKATNKQPTKTDQEALLGKWTIVSVEADGEPVPEMGMCVVLGTYEVVSKKNQQIMKLVVTPDNLTIWGNLQASYKLDPAKTPKVIELLHAGGALKGEWSKNIYRLDGDRLTLCLTRAQEAPTELATHRGDGRLLLVLTRGVEESRGAPPPFAIPSMTVPTSDQAKAIAKIKKLGGQVNVHEGSLFGLFKPKIDVHFSGTKMSDTAWESLKGLSNVQMLSLDDPQFTDVGLEHLKGLTELQALRLDETGVTDAGLEHLEKFSQLEQLGLAGTKITDAGLKHLKGLKHLYFLEIGSTGITDAGLAQVKEMGQLRILALEHTKITDAGLKNLDGLGQLIHLFLDGTNVTDAGLGYLNKLPKLRFLNLNHTKITDAGLEHLKGMSHLELVGLNDTKVTDEGVRKLQQALPKCKIERWK
jgi:uncharacterized protein (TIGR03067 family)